MHSALTGGAETRDTWRQPYTNLMLGAAGTPSAAVRYGLRFRWEQSYDEMSVVLYDKGLIGVRHVPGMTVPNDLDALFSLHTSGLAVRGWLEPAYYLLGSDFTGSSDTGALSYMANMGGWGILDYGLRFAPEPWDWLQLGYASYLSSWALMNTGRADTNYGYWFPGPENDGASGWQFMTAKFGRAWIRTDGRVLDWTVDVANRTQESIEIGDLALNLP